MKGAQLIQKNRNWQDEVLKRVSSVDRLEAAVGFPRGKEGLGNPHYENGASILQVAIWNNYGTTRGDSVHVPSRPFMKIATAKIREANNEVIRRIIQNIHSGKTDGIKELKTLAIQAQGIIQTTITDEAFTPNAPSTIEAKRSEQPLIDSGDMRKSVTWVIREKQ